MLCTTLFFVCLSPLHAQTNIAANDPNIQYIGRFDQSAPAAPIMGWDGTEIRANFQGTSIKAKFASWIQTNFNVYIDNTLTVLAVQGSSFNATSYTLATGLSNTTHLVRIIKRDSPWQAQAFSGFVLDAGKTLVAPPVRSVLKMEFYGDSQTQGAQTDITSGPDNDILIYDNNYNTYGAMVSRAFIAEFSCIAANGDRLTQASGSSVALPTVYDRSLDDITTPLWDFSRWQADVVCVNLGENDYWGMPSPPSKFVTDYIAFVIKLRGKYPNAKIILLSGPLEGGQNPSMVAYVSSVKDSMNRRGDSKVYYYHFLTTINHAGHPRTAEHQACADELVAFINAQNIVLTTAVAKPAAFAGRPVIAQSVDRNSGSRFDLSGRKLPAYNATVSSGLSVLFARNGTFQKSVLRQ